MAAVAKNSPANMFAVGSCKPNLDCACSRRKKLKSCGDGLVAKRNMPAAKKMKYFINVSPALILEVAYHKVITQKF